MTDWNPRDAGILNDQRQAFDTMREQCPVAHSDFMNWSLFRHADITAVLADTGTYSNASRFQAIPNGMDPPEHGPYRAALDEFFGAPAMERLEPDLRVIAGELLTPLLATHGGEVMADYVTPFALRSLCAMLGWPQDLWQSLAGWTHGNQQAAFNQDPAAGKALHQLLSDHVKTNLAVHRGAAGGAGGATTGLLKTQVDGKVLDDEQLISVLRNWTAGHGTVASGLGNVLLHLAQDPALQQRLRQDSTLIPRAIEEILRVDGPLVANRRVTTREVELQGRKIKSDEPVSLMWIAANRDPRVFKDAASVDIDRNLDASLVWGQGIHLCQGAPLARLELRVALEELLARTQGFALAGSVPPRQHFPGNGPLTLQLQLEA